MEELKVLKSNAIDAYQKADGIGKALLSNLLGKKHFLLKPIDRIKTFEDACEELGEDSALFNIGTADEIAFRKLKVIVRALNGDWVPNWNDGSQRKWFPWFYLNEPGFRFDGSHGDWTSARATGGSRLCFASQELSDYAAKQFLPLYKDLMA